MNNHNATILLVDDEADFQRLCGEWLAGFGYSVLMAGSAEQARERIAETDIDLAIVDLAMPPTYTPEEGLNLIPELKHIPVIVLTGHAEHNIALKAIKKGAWDFIAKPLNPDMLQVVVDRALVKRQLEKDILALKHSTQPHDMGLIGQSDSLQQLKKSIQRIAPTNLSVLITGPTGTGKELVAKAIHQASHRQDKPQITIHSAAIPDELLESELFGHVKGAFTGAIQDRTGLVALADGGTLFLDEVGDMPASMQVKLLRFLQEGTYFPVGGQQQLQANVRVLAATHKHLPQLIEAGEFREDLYYRLKGIELQTSALASRIEDIPPIAEAMADQAHCQIPSNVMQWLIESAWPGNVRELKNVLAYATAVCDTGSNIQLDDVKLAKGQQTQTDDAAETTILDSLPMQLQALERKLIVNALHQCKQNHTHSAKMLGISRAGLLKKMQRLNLR